MMLALKKVRIDNQATQAYCAQLLGVSLRSYKDYENDPAKVNSVKYQYFLDKLTEHFAITEDQGVLTRDFIVQTCAAVFKNYAVEYCYLFGSYAKNQARGDSDVDLLVATTCTGLQFYDLTEQLRENLHKKVDLLTLDQLHNNQELANQILKTGVKIYG